MLDMVLSVLTGGATGLIGTAISGILGLFQSRADYRHEVDLRRLDIELAKAEAGAAEKVAAVEAEGARDVAEWEAMTASYREASTSLSGSDDGFMLRFAEFVRRMTRPGLTWVLVAIIAVIFFTIEAMAPGVEDIRPRIVNTILYVGSAAVLWWFGQRQIEKRAVKGLPWLK